MIYNLLLWNRDSTRKCEHLFPIQSLLLSGCSYLFSHHSQGSSTERWSWITLRVVTARMFYVLMWSLTSPFIQWRLQRHSTWSTTHDVVSQEINPWKSFDYFMRSNLWPLPQIAKCFTTRPSELNYQLILNEWCLYRIHKGPWKPGMSWNLKIWIPGLENPGIFVEVLESPGIWT